MRTTILVLAFVLAGCGTTVRSAPPAPSRSPIESATARVTTSASRDCLVNWVHHFKTLPELAGTADVIVRAVAVGQDAVQLTPGFGPNATRDARRTTFRIVETLKGGAASDFRVLEDVCPNLDVAAGEEWLLFAYRADSSHGPSSGAEHFITAGGPQGQFRFVSGRVAGPFFTFAEVAHSYEGATMEQVLGDIRASAR